LWRGLVGAEMGIRDRFGSNGCGASIKAVKKC